MSSSPGVATMSVLSVVEARVSQVIQPSVPVMLLAPYIDWVEVLLSVRYIFFPATTSSVPMSTVFP